MRAILSAVEAGDAHALRREPLTIPQYDTATVAGHAELMKEAGLVDAYIVQVDAEPPQLAIVDRLTWAGQDFLAATRNDTIWAKAKQVVRRKAGDVPFDILSAHGPAEPILTKPSCCAHSQSGTFESS